MNTGTEIKKRALLLVEILSQDKLEKAVKFMENLSLKSNQKQQLYSPKSEKKILIKIIQSKLTREEQDRIHYLRHKNDNGEITEAEHRELLNYIEKVEDQDAERAKALIELAQIRNVDLATVIEEFTPEEKTPNVV